MLAVEELRSDVLGLVVATLAVIVVVIDGVLVEAKVKFVVVCSVVEVTVVDDVVSSIVA